MKQGQLTGLRRALRAKNRKAPEQLAQWLEQLEAQYLAASTKISDKDKLKLYNDNAENARQAAALLREMGEMDPEDQDDGGAPAGA